MPTYRVICEQAPVAGVVQRAPRGAAAVRDVRTVVAADIHAAILDVLQSLEPNITATRVTSVEELLAPTTFTDAEITAALTAPGFYEDEPMVDPEDFGDDDDLGDAGWVAGLVARALDASGMVPGLRVDAHYDYTGNCEGATVSVYDEVRRLSVSVLVDPDGLSVDADARGWDGVLAAARALLGLSAELQ